MLPNKFTGYCFLVDEKNRIRWRGHGKASDGEIDILINCAKALINERP